MQSFTDVTYEDLRQCVTDVFRRGGGSRPDVVVLSLAGRNVVLKDYNACDRWFGACLGPLLAHREAKALRRLEGIPGVPRLLRRVDRRALLIEYFAAQPLKTAPRPLPPLLFERLLGLVDEIHRRGVAHCDLRSPNNTLVDERGNPVVVDFVACVFRGHRANLPWGWVFRQFCGADVGAVLKLESRFAPSTCAAALPEGQARWLHRLARSVGAGVRRLSRALLTRS